MSEVPLYALAWVVVSTFCKEVLDLLGLGHVDAYLRSALPVIWGSRFKIDSGLRVEGLWFKVWGSGFGVEGLEFGV